MSTSNKGSHINPLLQNLTNALYFDTNGNVAVRTGITGNIQISGPITIPGTVTVASSPENPVHVHVTESIPIDLSSSTLAALERITVDQGTNPWIVSRNSTLNGAGNPIYVNFTNTTIGLDAGSNTIGNVGLNAGSNTIGKVDQGTGGTSAWKVDIGTTGSVTLLTGSATIGNVGLNAGTNTIGKVAQDNTSPWYIGLNAGTNTIGKVDQGTNPWIISRNNIANAANNAIYTDIGNTGSVALLTGSATIGYVGLNAGSNTIGKVAQDNTSPWYVGLNAGSNTIGKVAQDKTTPWTVGLDAGSNIIGKVDQASTSNPWVISGNLSSNSAQNPIYTSGTTSISTPVTIGGFPDSATTAFDEPLAVGITPLIQADAIYGLDSDIWEMTQLNSGTVTTNSDTGVWSVNCVSQAGSYARLYTSRYARYQPGQGMMFRWTAAFTTSGGTLRTSTGVTNAVQVAGPIDREDGYVFGFSGNSTDNQIGILHRRAGKVEVRQLTITTAPTGIQTATITLNSIPYTVSLTASTSVNYTAEQISRALIASGAGQYWQIEACGGIVTFDYYSPGAQAGTYSFSSSGAGTLAAGTITRLVTGASPVDTWYYQNTWDNQTVSFDPAHLNVYAVDFRWLGAGIVRFFMEDPDTGKMVLVHTLHWTKNQTSVVPHISKPMLRISYRVGSITGLTPAAPVTLRGASIFAAVQGTVAQTAMSQGWYAIDSTSRAKDTAWHLMSLQNPYIIYNTLNKSSLVLQSLTVAAQNNDPSIIFIVKNAVGTSDLLVYSPVPGTKVFAQYSVSAVTENLAVDTIANVQTLGINGSSQFDLMPYNFSLAPGDKISVFIQSSNAITRTSVGLTWRVD